MKNKSILFAGILFCSPFFGQNTNSTNVGVNTNQGQGITRWKLNGNIGTGNEFIGTTNQQDLILKSGNEIGLRINPNKDIIIPGQMYMELHRPLDPGGERLLTIDYNGKITSLEKSNLLKAFYSQSCIPSIDINGNVSYLAPVWENSEGTNHTLGYLFTGVDCPARVGIGTSTPESTLDVKGEITSTTISVNTDNSGSEALKINSTNSGQNVLTISTEGKLTTDKINVFDPNNPTYDFDANLYVDGNSHMAGPLTFSGVEPEFNWNTWEARIIIPNGGAIVTNEIGTDGNYKNFGITNNGWYFGLSDNVIGHTSSPDIKYAAFIDNSGRLVTREVEVTLAGWPDFVFEDSYNLIPLVEVKQYILENNHLPGVPAENEIIDNGLNLGEMDAILMQKIEELTLYIIQLEEQINELKSTE